MAQARSHDGATVTSAILRQVAHVPAKPCLIFAASGQTLTYAELYRESLRLAGLLRGAGARRGDLVLIFLPTHPDAYAAFVGAMLLGAVPSFMPTPSPKQEPGQYWRDHAALLTRATPRLIVTDDPTADAIAASGVLVDSLVTLLRVGQSRVPLPEEAIVASRPDEVALLQHSSGTTGLKKGVMLSHAAILAQVGAYAEALLATDRDIVATWLPIYHDMGLVSSTLLPLMLGQTIVILDPFGWAARPATLLTAIARTGATLVWQPNFAFEHLTRTVRAEDCDADLSGVRAFINCSEPCRPATVDRFAAHFASLGVRPDQLQACYAMAETVFAVTQTRPAGTVRRLSVAAAALRGEGLARPPGEGEARLEVLSNGPPIAGMWVVAVTPQGEARGEREVGELLVGGTSLFDGYFRLPEQTAERLSAVGLRTRDLGFVADGEVYVLGRLDDLIIVHGRNYTAGEIEAAVNAVPGVRPGRAVAFGIDNPQVGSQDIVLVAESELDAEAAAGLSRRLKRVVQQEIGVALFEVRIVRPGWLSKTTSGKISRERNRLRYLAERPPIPDAAST